ncbi:Cyclin-dependent kinase 14 [Sparganum proliferum]
MTADPTLSPVRNFGRKSRLHRSTGSISLASSAAGSATDVAGGGAGGGDLSTILSDSCSSSKDTGKHKSDRSSGLGGGGGNKPRQLKRLRSKAAAEPETAIGSAEDQGPLVKVGSLVYSKSSTPVAQDFSHKSHRRTRSASGSTTKLASLWSFLFSGAGGRHKQHAVAPLEPATAVTPSSA